LKSNNRTTINTTPDFTTTLAGDSCHGDPTLYLLWDALATDGQPITFFDLLSSNMGQEIYLSPGFQGVIYPGIIPSWLEWSSGPEFSEGSN
jgi:hypothetical protein